MFYRHIMGAHMLREAVDRVGISKTGANTGSHGPQWGMMEHTRRRQVGWRRIETTGPGDDRHWVLFNCDSFASAHVHLRTPWNQRGAIDDPVARSG